MVYKKRLRDKVQGLVRNHLGVTLVANWRMNALPQARYLQTMFRLAGVDCVLDVGANAGQYYRFLRDAVGFEGHIVSFEPIPELARANAERAKNDSKWFVRECALGRTAGRATFNVMRGQEFSSFLEPNDTSAKFMGEGNEPVRSVDVEVSTLDAEFAMWQERLGFRCPYLKMDTQGFDLEVAVGGPTALRSVVALQTEASLKPIYVGMPELQETIRVFRAADFEVSGVFPNNDSHFPLLFELDLHFVANRLVGDLQSRVRAAP